MEEGCVVRVLMREERREVAYLLPAACLSLGLLSAFYRPHLSLLVLNMRCWRAMTGGERKAWAER